MLGIYSGGARRGTKRGKSAEGKQTGRPNAKRARAPKTQQQQQQQDDSTKENMLKDHRELLNKSWKIHQVSPLTDFRYENMYIKQYERLLTNGLLNNVQSFDSLRDTVYQTKISILSELKGQPHEKDAFKIEVYSAIEDNKRLIYTAILYSMNLESHNSGTLVYLPVMLTSGHEGIRKKINYVLENAFACVITMVEYSGYDIMDISAFWCTFKNIRKKVNMVFQYIPQHSDKGTQVLEVMLDTEAIHNVIDKIGISDANTDTCKMFHKVLNMHLRLAFSINFQYCTLKQIVVPVAVFSVQGKIRVNNVSAVEPIFGWISRHCVNKPILRSISDNED